MWLQGGQRKRNTHREVKPRETISPNSIYHHDMHIDSFVVDTHTHSHTQEVVLIHAECIFWYNIARNIEVMEGESDELCVHTAKVSVFNFGETLAWPKLIGFVTNFTQMPYFVRASRRPHRVCTKPNRSIPICCTLHPNRRKYMYYIRMLLL